MVLFGVEAENDSKILFFLLEIKERMKKSSVFQNSRAFFQTKKKDLFIVFDFPRSVYAEVIVYLMIFLLFASSVVMYLVTGTPGLYWFQWIFIVILSFVSFSMTPVFFYQIFKFALGKRGYKGKVKLLSPEKVLRRVVFEEE